MDVMRRSVDRRIFSELLKTSVKFSFFYIYYIVFFHKSLYN